MAKKTRRNQVTVSRLKSFLSFSDTFTSGFASGWKSVRGTWSASAGTATAADTNYPIRTVQMTNENVTITLENPGVGSGAALWVTDSGTWWSLVSKQTTCSGCGSCSSTNPYNPCGAGGTCIGSGGNCIGTGGNCVATPGNYVPCSGCGGNTYYYNYYTPGNPASNYSCSMYNPTGNCKYGSTYNYTNPGYFGTVLTANPYNPCCSGGYTNAANPCGSSNPYNPCGATNPYNPCSSTNPCVGTGGTCASYYDTYPQYLKLYKYAASTLTELASVTLASVTSFAPIRAIKVAITGSNKVAETATVTAKAFSDTSAVSQIGGDLVHNATGVKIITNYGIIASDSAYNQSLSVDGVTIV